MKMFSYYSEFSDYCLLTIEIVLISFLIDQFLYLIVYLQFVIDPGYTNPALTSSQQHKGFLMEEVEVIFSPGKVH